jgi:hypothetical protein
MIAVIVVVALVAGPAVIGAVGAMAGALGASAAAAGVIGAVVGGAIVGAAAGAVTKMGENLIDGKNLMEGVGQAALIGAIGGALGGAGNALGQHLAKEALKQGASMATQSLLKFGIETGFDTVGNILGDLVSGNPITFESVMTSTLQGIGMSLAMSGAGKIKAVEATQTKFSDIGAGFGTSVGNKIKTGFGGGIDTPTTTPHVDTPNVKQPEVEVKAPTTEVKAPEVEVKAPTTEVKAPETEVRTPANNEPDRPNGRTTHADEPEVEPGIVAKEPTADGREIKVTKEGEVLRCTGSCEIVQDPKVDEISNPKRKAEEAVDVVDEAAAKKPKPDETTTEKSPETKIETTEPPSTTTKDPVDTNSKRQRPIPEGGVSIEERIKQGGNPPPHAKANPDKYYYDKESGQYVRRPEPKPDFSSGDRAIPCFPAGTLVITKNGKLPIESLSVEMNVQAFDEFLQFTLDKPITALHRNRTVRLVEIITENETLSATTRHRFWVEDKQQWIAARYLESGMMLRTITGEITNVKDISIREVEEQDTYNLTVADCHTYFVGNTGILVHNEDETPRGKIYIGRDPITGEIVYVGQTKQELDTRESDHHRDAIKEPEKYGFKKDMKLELVLDGLTDDEMDYHERRVYDEQGGEAKLNNRQIPMTDEILNIKISITTRSKQHGLGRI